MSTGEETGGCKKYWPRWDSNPDGPSIQAHIVIINRWSNISQTLTRLIQLSCCVSSERDDKKGRSTVIS